MNLQLYSDELFSIQIDRYELGNDVEAAPPKKIVSCSISDQNQFAVAICDEVGRLIGFFGLHIGEQPEIYGKTDGSYALIKEMSIDVRHRGKGYATQCFEQIFEFINDEISEDITCLVLSVNEKNFLAQRVYEKADFKKRNDLTQGLVIMEKRKRMG